MTHIVCQRCAEWQGNLGDDKPIGWLELYDDTAQLAGWFWDHDCGRIVVKADEMPRILTKQRVRRYPNRRVTGWDNLKVPDPSSPAEPKPGAANTCNGWWVAGH